MLWGHHQFHVATPSPPISLSGPNQSCSWLPWLFAVYRGWSPTQLYGGYNALPVPNMAPENRPSQEEISSSNHPSSGAMLVSGSVSHYKDPYDLNRSWGDIADLYASDEKDAIRNGVRSGCKGAGIQETWSRVGGTPWKMNGWNLRFSPVWKGTSSEPNLHFWVPWHQQFAPKNGWFPMGISFSRAPLYSGATNLSFREGKKETNCLEKSMGNWRWPRSFQFLKMNHLIWGGTPEWLFTVI